MSNWWQQRGRLVLTILAVVVVIAGTAFVNERTREPLPAVAKKHSPNEHLEVSGWLPYYDDGAGLKTFKDNIDSFKEIHPFWYEAQSATDIKWQGNSSWHHKVKSVIDKSDALEIPTLTETLDTAAFTALLNDASARAAHTAAVCDLVTKNNLDGIDIDYETFVLKLSVEEAPKLAPLFSQWLGELATCLHAHNKKLQVTVLPRTADPRWAYFEEHLSVAVFDYAAIGAVADIIRPMAYDFSWPGSPAGSVDPIEWVKAVIKYTTDRVPPEKVDLGLPLYGYDWLNKGRAITAQNATALAAKSNVVPTRDPTTQSLVFTYLEGENVRTVWFDDAQATALRVDLARQVGIRGVTFWAMGQQIKDTWPLLSTKP